MPALSETSIRPLGVDTDSESIIGTLRRRWWVIPIVFAVVGGLVLLQDPETSVQSSYSRVDREYQVVDNTLAMTLLDLPTDLLSPIPTLDTQIVQLATSDEYRELAASFPEVSLDVRRSSPQLALQPMSEGEGIVALRGRVATILSVTCIEAKATKCDAALDGLAEVLINRHNAALRAGLQQLTITVESLRVKVDEAEAIGQRLKAVASAIETLDSQDLAGLVFVRQFNAEEAESTMTESPNYRFAIAASIILSILVLLQWSIIDKRIYGLRRIARIVGSTQVIGHVADVSAEDDTVAAAAALRRIQGSATTIRLVTLSGVATPLLATVVSRSGGSAAIVGISQLGDSVLSDPSMPSVIVAQRVRSDTRELARVNHALTMSSGLQPSVLMLG